MKHTNEQTNEKVINYNQKSAHFMLLLCVNVRKCALIILISLNCVLIYIQNWKFSFAGHSGAVTCMMVPKNTNFLITGSEDTSVIVWDIKTLTVKVRLW